MDREQLLLHFTAITGCTKDQALFYLESAAFDVDLALSTFYDDDRKMDSSALSSRTSSPPPPADGFNAAISAPQTAAVVGSSGRVAYAGQSTSVTKKAPTATYSSSSRMKTLADLKREQEEANGDESDVEDDEDKKGATFYAGGEKSGIALQGNPAGRGPKKNHSSNNLIDKILKKASAGGREELNEEGAGGGSSNWSAFGGTGRSLTADATASSTGPSASTTTTSSSSEQSLPVAKRRITFWKDGFSIDNGELKSMDDHENRAFLEALTAGRAPLHYLNVLPGQQVTMEVEHRMEEMYTPSPLPPLQPFAGTGHRLGAVVPAASTSATAASTAPSREISLHEGEAVANISVRCADGTRLTIQVNASHTIGDVMQHLQARKPVPSRFLLSSTFPKKDFADEGVTLGSAGLLNAALVQKLV